MFKWFQSFSFFFAFAVKWQLNLLSQGGSKMRRSSLLLEFPVLLLVLSLAGASHADEFDNLRFKWGVFLNGGTNLNLADPAIASRVSAIGNGANSNWKSMSRSAGRTHLWPDAARLNQSEDITTCYSRLRSMALGWATRGQCGFQQLDIGGGHRQCARLDEHQSL